VSLVAGSTERGPRGGKSYAERQQAKRDRYAADPAVRAAAIARAARNYKPSPPRARPERRSATQKSADWRAANRDTYNAHGRARGAVARALAKGVLVRQPCERCERVDTQAHHDDYDKPLDVRWLCPPHHREADR